jgi:hypothetical protein
MEKYNIRNYNMCHDKKTPENWKGHGLNEVCPKRN